MTSESLLLPLLNSTSSNASQTKDHDGTSKSSTTIVVLPDSTPSVTFVPPLKTIDAGNFNPTLAEKQKSPQAILMGNVSRRLKKRKEFHNQL
jgi:hypothetical protein